MTPLYHKGNTVPGQWKARKGRRVATECFGCQEAGSIVAGAWKTHEDHSACTVYL